MGRDWSNFYLEGRKVIAFHDIVPGPVENIGGVPQFWKEIKDHYSNKEVVEDWGQGGYGIGIIFPT